MKTQRSVRTPLAALIMMTFHTNAIAAEESHDHATMDESPRII
nr:hypothetical protein [Enterobacter ludwigii]CAH8249936.1 Uncharacterised protein [Enterobacter ludwigii]